jgi:hypothetical protein
MRTIIAGSRGCVNLNHLIEALKQCNWKPTSILSGGANGADRLGELWAKSEGLFIDMHPANWNLHGRSAGYRRNEEMAKKAEALIALWNGKSPGTQHMINIAKNYELKTLVYIYKD